jgi:hypothetical protein
MPRFRKDLSDAEIEFSQRDLMAELRKGFVKHKPMQFKPEYATKPKPKAKKRKKAKQGTQAHQENQAQQGNQTKRRPSGQGSNISSTREGQDNAFKIIEGGLDYLENVYKEPNLSLTARGIRLGLSADKRTAIKNNLIDNNFVDEFSVDLGKEFAGIVKMLKLTTKGYQVLGKNPPKKSQAKQGSLEHQWWQINCTRNYISKGHKAIIEYELNGKAADIGVEKDCEMFAVEIELTPKNAIYNFRADIEAGFKRVVIGCKNTRVKKQIEAQMQSFITDNTSFVGKANIVKLSEFPFVKQLYKEIKGY